MMIEVIIHAIIKTHGKEISNNRILQIFDDAMEAHPDIRDFEIVGVHFSDETPVAERVEGIKYYEQYPEKLKL